MIVSSDSVTSGKLYWLTNGPNVVPGSRATTLACMTCPAALRNVAILWSLYSCVCLSAVLWLTCDRLPSSS